MKKDLILWKQVQGVCLLEGGANSIHLLNLDATHSSFLATQNVKVNLVIKF